ncbi:hypothetical protein D3C71_1017670 [compost metagenome]
MDDFVFGIERQDAHDGAEDFLLHDLHAVFAIREHGGRHVGTLGQGAFHQADAAGQQLGAFALADFNPAQHVVHVGRADQRAEVRAGIERVADADARHPFQHSGFKRCLVRAMHEHARAVGAYLARAEEVGHDRDIGGALKAGIGQHDQRRLAAKFQRDALERSGGHAHDLLAGVHTAGERHFRHARVARQPVTDFAAAAQYHVEHAVGHARLRVDLGQPQGRQRRDLGGLEHHGVAGGQGRGGLPHGNLDGIVPCADARNHAQRFAARVEETGFAQGHLDALHRRRQPRVILDDVHTGGDVDGTGFGQRLAGIQRFKLSQFVVALAQHLRRLQQHSPALRRSACRPYFLPFLRAGHRAVYVLPGGHLHFRQHRAVGGVYRGDGLAADGVGAPAVDIELLDGQGHGNPSCCQSEGGPKAGSPSNWLRSSSRST